MKTECQCDICKAACTHKPGWFKPGEAEKVADFLGMSLKELFETRLGVDWWEDEDPIFILAPLTESGDPGEEYPADPRGWCTFFDPRTGLCEIHDVKPYECAHTWHEDSKEYIHKVHKEVAMSWKDHQAQIVDLLGRQPKARELTFADVLCLISETYINKAEQ